MPYRSKTYHIAGLIYKAILNSLSDQEERELGQWLKEKNNQALYDQIINSKNIENKRVIYSKLNKGASYERLQNKIREREIKKGRSRNLFNIYKYAAAVLLLMIGGYILFMWTVKDQNETFEIVKHINPGYEKATLVLSDGSTVDLENNKDKIISSTGGSQIENRNNILSYKPQVVKKKGNDKTLFNTLHVPIGGIYTLELPDGSKVWVNSASSIKYPEVFNQDKRMVELEGEAYFEVVKDKKEFIVKTKSREITVLGTSFNVSSYHEDTFFATTLVEGKVKLTDGGGDANEVYLNPGQRAFLDKRGKNNLILKEVDTKIYTSWKDGKFYFEQERLENILAKTSRWYDFEVIFADAALKNVTFTGIGLKDYPAERILNLISKTSKVNYEISKNKTNKKLKVKILKKE